jgi:hypothetical protein
VRILIPCALASLSDAGRSERLGLLLSTCFDAHNAHVGGFFLDNAHLSAHHDDHQRNAQNRERYDVEVVDPGFDFCDTYTFVWNEDNSGMHVVCCVCVCVCVCVCE